MSPENKTLLLRFLLTSLVFFIMFAGFDALQGKHLDWPALALKSVVIAAGITLINHIFRKKGERKNPAA